MDISKLWNKPKSTFELLTRLILIFSIIAAGTGMVWIFVSLRLDKAIAANTAFAPQTTKRPSAVALDGNGHVWVAESDCDSSPLCAPSIGRGVIAEYDAVGGGLNEIAEFIPHPSNIYNPTFLAFDKQGNVWFTDPTHGAIGRLIPATNTWTEYSVSNRFHNAVPYDLVFDKNGTLWFTDYINGAIGRFDTEKNVVRNETHTPSQGAALYSITQAPDGTIWYTINNKKALGSFRPPLRGAPVLQEHTVPTDQLHATITDGAGDVWFSGGFHGQVGEYVPTTGQTKMFCVSGASSNSHIAGMTVDNNSGDVWFIDSTNARIGVLDPTQYQDDNCMTGGTSGIAYSQLAANAHPLDGITVDGAGNVFFTDLAGKELGEISIAPVKPKSTSPYPPGPVAKTWYFPDGHIGDGYRESITINNPDPTNQCTFTLQYIRGTGQTMSKQIKLNPASRTTESVNGDFHLSEKKHGDTVSTIVSNDVDSDCPGIVAERSLYFTIGDNSGTDIAGATFMAKSFYFANVTSGLGARSYFSILNPPGGRTADVTVDYYASSTRIGTQSIQVASGSHSMITPTQIHLPLHSIAVVTSSEPVVVEQSTYFRKYGGSSLGTLDGATALIGAPSVQHRWFFTAGFVNEPDISGHAQTDLVISNLDLTTNKPAEVTITLTNPDKSLHTFQLTVQPRRQAIWNINEHIKEKTFLGVAAMVTSSGAGIVVQRQTFFQYVHTINSKTLNAQGVTDVLGQTTDAASYSFAEGNNNDGYHEWLHLYNPGNKTTIIYVTMISALGDVYSRSFGVEAHGQMALDISTYTQQQLGIPGNTSSYQIFLTAQTLNGQRFVAERTQYFNTLGSDFVIQGGTDVFGYGGQ